MVPLRMTSIAAVPEMGVKVFLLGEGRYTSLSVPELEVDPAEIVFDLNTNSSNWPAAVARTIDAAQGEGLVVDSAATVDVVRAQLDGTFTPPIGDEDPEVGRQALLGLLDGTRYVTRMYGRFSAEEMGVDLTFEAAPDLPDVDRNRQLTVEQVPLCSDGSVEPPPPDPCAFVACGQGGTCLVAPDANGILVPGCACVDGATARSVVDSASPSGFSVSCIDVRMNVDPIIDTLPGIDDNGGTVDPTPPPLPDPCVGNPCGDFGSCFAFNAQQTCLCERGYVAVAETNADGKSIAVCRSPDGTVPDDFYRRRLPEPRLPYPGKAAARGTLSDDGCAATGGTTASPLWFLVLGGPLVVRRRRRRAD
jgi:putative hemolysin